jgi:hypothetical protein
MARDDAARLVGRVGGTGCGVDPLAVIIIFIP